MTRIALLLAFVALTGCGYSTDEYALNRAALAPGAGIVGGPVKDISPVSGELIGGGTSARSFGNPEYERYDPLRGNRR